MAVVGEPTNEGKRVVQRNGAILNSRLVAAIVALRHGESMVLADAGLPVPPTVEVLDLSLAPGVPGLCQTLEVVAASLQIESAVLATELSRSNPMLEGEIARLLRPAEVHHVDHETLKSMVSTARLVVRTGEVTPYANVVLVGGVPFG
jgi:D-ribose pyranase